MKRSSDTRSSSALNDAVFPVLLAVIAAAWSCCATAAEPSRINVASPSDGRTLVVERSEAGWTVLGCKDELDSPDSYTNEEYGFTVRRPSPDWLRHVRGSTRLLVPNPDAVVEFVKPAGWAFVVVIPQRAAGDVQELSEAAMDAATSRLETVGPVESHEITVSGCPAVSAEYSGTYGGEQYTFRHVCIKTPGRFLQICCFSPKAAFEGNADDFERLVDSVTVAQQAITLTKARGVSGDPPGPARPAPPETARASHAAAPSDASSE
jgi:hypothetical protein